MPKIWKLQDKVVGIDLGDGRFQFDFRTEEELPSVLFHAPYHFDGFMISLVRWEPSFAPKYPSAVSFWVQLLDVPTHILDEAILRLVGGAIGEVVGIDVKTTSAFVTFDGFKSLLFQTTVPLDSGIELEVGLDYDKLAGFCGKCFKLTHDDANCPEDKLIAEEKDRVSRVSKGKGTFAEVVAQNYPEPRWESQIRPSTKRALDFKEEEKQAFPYKKVGKDRQAGTTREEELQRDPKQTRGGNKYNGIRMGYQGRGSRGAPSTQWPAPLYQKRPSDIMAEDMVTAPANLETDIPHGGSGVAVVEEVHKNEGITVDLGEHVTTNTLKVVTQEGAEIEGEKGDDTSSMLEDEEENKDGHKGDDEDMSKGTTNDQGNKGKPKGGGSGVGNKGAAGGGIPKPSKN